MVLPSGSRSLAQEIRKMQFDPSAVMVKEGASVQQIWDAVLTT